MFEEIPTLLPLGFFSVSFEIKKKMSLLPSLTKYLDEKEFAKIYMKWDKEGLYFIFDVKSSLEKDKIEIFLDTRNIKNHHITKFCHHFLIIPNNLEIEEVTKFIKEDMHPLAKKKDFKISLKKKSSSYLLNLFISKNGLYGYDPENFNKIGFTYRIAKENYEVQHFSSSKEECNIDKNPYFWATGVFVK